MGLMLGIFPLFYVSIIPMTIILKIEQLFNKIFNINPEESVEYIPEITE